MFVSSRQDEAIRCQQNYERTSTRREILHLCTHLNLHLSPIVFRAVLMLPLPENLKQVKRSISVLYLNQRFDLKLSRNVLT